MNHGLGEFACRFGTTAHRPFKHWTLMSWFYVEDNISFICLSPWYLHKKRFNFLLFTLYIFIKIYQSSKDIRRNQIHYLITKLPSILYINPFCIYIFYKTIVSDIIYDFSYHLLLEFNDISVLARCLCNTMYLINGYDS